MVGSHFGSLLHLGHLHDAHSLLTLALSEEGELATVYHLLRPI